MVKALSELPILAHLRPDQLGLIADGMVRR
jgi:hypothetical protein